MWRWLSHNHQTLTAIGAMLVGVAALFVAWDQGRVMRAQQHGSVYPALQIDGYVNDNGETREVGVRVSNNGVGPAIVESVRILRSGEDQTGASGLVERLPEGYHQSWSSMVGRIIAPGETVQPLGFSWSGDAHSEADFAAFGQEWFRWDLEICYCSVFERCWMNSTDRSGPPRSVDQCRRDEIDIFEAISDVPEAQEPEE